MALLLFALAFAPGHVDASSPGIGPLLETLRATPREGKNNAEASRAWRQLVDVAQASDLSRILRALRGADPLGANWIRAAAEVVAERSLAAGAELPASALERLVLDRKEDPRARELAFEWLVRTDPSARDRLIPGMTDDPSVELRRQAVARLMDEAQETKSQSDAVRAYRRALGAARDTDQIEACEKRLQELGEKVDLPRHFGFLMRWQLVGPFDNRGTRGFDTAYPPEENIDLEAEYEGKNGRVRWREHVTDHRHGLVDLNKVLVHEKGVVGYAVHVFTADEPRDIEFRLATTNAWKLWLNGELLFARDEYHHGTRIDHYRVKGTLKEGPNQILLKVCQNEQTEDWTDSWRFQIRVCDATGTAVLSTTRNTSANTSKQKAES